MPQDTIHTFEIPPDYDALHSELTPEPTVDAYSFGMVGGEQRHDTTVTFNESPLTCHEKYYIEVVPDEPTEVDVSASYNRGGGDDDWERVLDTHVTLHVGDEMWLSLRPGESTFGVERA